jgi:ABC-type multidrug transport system ATPase subunit
MEMPGFEKLFTEHAKDGLLIVAVSEDEDRAALDKYLQEKHLSFQSEIFYTYGFKTAESVLRFYGELSEMSPEDIALNAPRQLTRLGLEQAAARKVNGFSKGMVQRLGLAQALLHRPDLLILDEPTTGLDPEGRKLVADIIQEEKQRGTTVFLSSHILSDIYAICGRSIQWLSRWQRFARSRGRRFKKPCAGGSSMWC